MTASPIRLLEGHFDVLPALAQIEAHPEIWNTHTMRTDLYGTPHREIDDIWVRYNAFENFKGDLSTFNGEHDSSWYPDAAKIPAVAELVMDVMAKVRGERLGGVLITRIPPGGQVKPHIDQGWHARYYEKFAVQLMGHPDQAFCFKNARLSAMSGQLYTFDNSHLHWVTNDSDQDRMTLIICIRGAHHVIDA